MMLWLVFALITTGTLTIVLAPLWRPMSPSPCDIRKVRRLTATVIATVLVAGAGLFYAAQGNPQLPGRPYSERLKNDPDVIIAKAADDFSIRLTMHPDAAGYRQLAGLYAASHQYDRAVAAMKRSILRGADTADNWAQLGEILVAENAGRISPAALSAFATALQRDGREPRARFYAGLAEAQIGHFTVAVAIWRDLERDSRPDAPWLPQLRQQIGAVAKFGKFDATTIPPAPPSVAALGAAIEAMNAAVAGG